MALPMMGGVCRGLTRDGGCVMALPMMGGVCCGLTRDGWCVSWPYP